MACAAVYASRSLVLPIGSLSWSRRTGFRGGVHGAGVQEEAHLERMGRTDRLARALDGIPRLLKMDGRFASHASFRPL
ncbi:ATP-dependent RNA helicase-like protein sub2 [Alternaria alternata]|nr:ATP-dependent RNA helicase-like protein sub2 [Alternaria alternata]